MEKIFGQELQALFEDDRTLQSLYDKLLPSFQRHVVKNSGTLEEANDLFQESVLVAYRKALDPTFLLTSSLETFIFSIGKKKWLYELRERKDKVGIMDMSDDEGNDIDEIVIKEQRRNLYRRHFKNLPMGCKDLLDLFFMGLKMSEIAVRLNFASEGYARKRKHDCKEKLINLIKADPIFQELKNG